MADSSGLRLVALKCQKCGSHLNADPKDVVYYCGNCDSGYELLNETDELIPVGIEFALPSKPEEAETIYYPFWVFDADITISSRNTFNTVSGLIGKLTGKDGNELSIEKFYIPAFETPKENIKKMGIEFTKNQPVFDTVSKDKLTGCIFSSKDAEKIADFIFLSMEAEKSDMLKNISYSLGLSSPRIVGIPFYKKEKLTDGILGISI